MLNIDISAIYEEFYELAIVHFELKLVDMYINLAKLQHNKRQTHYYQIMNDNSEYLSFDSMFRYKRTNGTNSEVTHAHRAMDKYIPAILRKDFYGPLDQNIWSVSIVESIRMSTRFT